MFTYALLISFLYLALPFSNANDQSALTDPALKVNQQRLEARIFELAKFGQNEIRETSRVAFSDADLEGRAYVFDLMKSMDLQVTIDYAGNIVGKRKGKNPSKKPIVFGSHIDTVPDGGNYDGCVGSMSALEVIQTLNENDVITDHPLEVIIFSDEEGGLVGSRALSGLLRTEAFRVVNSHGGPPATNHRSRAAGRPANRFLLRRCGTGRTTEVLPVRASALLQKIHE